MQKTNKALDTGLASLMKALGALSGGGGGGEVIVRLLERVLEAWAGEHDAFLHSRELAGKRKKDRHGDPSSDGTRVFYSTQCGYIRCLTR